MIGLALLNDCGRYSLLPIKYAERRGMELGSSLYYWTGDQIMVDTLSECENNGKQQSVFQLAGAALGTVSTTTGSPPTVTAFPTASTDPVLSASFFLKMPFNSISSLSKPNPLPTDLNHVAAAAA